MMTFGDTLASIRTSKGISQEQLADAMNMSQGAISHFETSRRLPSFMLAARMARFLGVKVSDLIESGVSLVSKSDKDAYPEQYEAHKAVNFAISHGELLPAKTYKCRGCDKQAAQWHHPSYRSEDRLNIVPLCRKCHKKVHRGILSLDLGVVPTAVGLIRIAIAPA